MAAMFSMGATPFSKSVHFFFFGLPKANDVLTFVGTLLDPSASGTGKVTGAVIKDSNGVIVVSGLSAGPIGSTNDIILSNTTTTAGQVVQVNSMTITGAQMAEINPLDHPPIWRGLVKDLTTVLGISGDYAALHDAMVINEFCDAFDIPLSAVSGRLETYCHLASEVMH
jgi:hypothetical protein